MSSVAPKVMIRVRESSVGIVLMAALPPRRHPTRGRREPVSPSARAPRQARRLRAHSSTGAFYQHFVGKTALLRLLFEELPPELSSGRLVKEAQRMLIA
jgi:hypothetical protein